MTNSGGPNFGRISGEYLGPHPKHAILPVLLVLGVVGWVAYKNPGPIQASTAQQVTVMKPIEGTATGVQEMPIVALYGVPTERTMDGLKKVPE